MCFNLKAGISTSITHELIRATDERGKDWRVRSLRSFVFLKEVTMINDISAGPLLFCRAPHLLRSNMGWQGLVSTCMTHPPVTQPGPADGRPFGKHHKRTTTLQSHPQGRSILENLDLMPAFTNRARRRAIILRKHPSGKFHLIIMSNCGIRLKSRAQNNSGLWGECYFAGDHSSHTVGPSGLSSRVTLLF